MFSGANWMMKIKTPAMVAMEKLANLPKIIKFDGDGDNSEAVLELCAAIILADGEERDCELEKIRSFLSTKYSRNKVDDILASLGRHGGGIEKACSLLSSLQRDDLVTLTSTLCEVAYIDGEYSASEKAVIADIGGRLGLEPELIETLEMDAKERCLRRERMIRSGAALICAGIIISVFILTATFVKSVLFGLILAVFISPLQQWFETRFMIYRPVAAFFNACARLVGPVKSFSQRIRNHFSSTGPAAPLTAEPESPDREAIRRINISCWLTYASLLSIALAIALSFSYFSVSYLSGLGTSVNRWVRKTSCHIEKPEAAATVHTIPEATVISATNQADKAPIPADSDRRRRLTGEDYLRALAVKLEKWRPKIESLPGFELLRNEAEDWLRSPDKRRELMHFILSRSGGIFDYTSGALGVSAAFAMNLLLAVFFFSLFLRQLAVFRYRAGDKASNSLGSYCANGILRSAWMPEISQETKDGAASILDDIFGKLQIWIRGYCSIIILETIIYVSIFSLLGVPYAPLVGLVAGFTILLPFIGPLASAVLTVAVCLAAAESSMLLVLLVICSYLLVNGVLEQLFIYPYFVGEALGLNVLETIVVVLLGGIFAGISGMIFAVPTASVLKYLAPKIYGTWHHLGDTNAGGD